MKKIEIKTEILVAENIEDLNSEDKTLLMEAKNALEKSYSNYSNFKVGAAVLLENGEIINGANQENAAYPMCLCAERVALAAASSIYPQSPVKAIAVTVKNPVNKVTTPAAPCGACRQVMSETEDRYGTKMKVIMQGEEGEIYQVQSVKDLLPLFFTGDFL
ncbi:MAG TPA: cytidine deaminase [Saprospiraceae bacterium]|nr:cytidine deaminase [Saprospiraceae bacterium]